MVYLIFLGIGLAIIILGLKTNEEVVRLSSAIIGTIFLIWGLTITPQPVLLAAEIIAVIATFRICVRCCECE